MNLLAYLTKAIEARHGAHPNSLYAMESRQLAEMRAALVELQRCIGLERQLREGAATKQIDAAHEHTNRAMEKLGIPFEPVTEGEPR